MAAGTRDLQRNRFRSVSVDRDGHRLLTGVRSRRAFVGLIFPGLLMLALLYPSLLSLADHHAAERVPTHSHVAAGAQGVPTHSHAFETAHTHAYPPVSAESERAFVAFAGNGTIVVPTPAASGSGVEHPALVLSALAVAGALIAVGFGQQRSAARPWQLLIAPPTRPPRRALLTA
jgi:hypothetical protein